MQINNYNNQSIGFVGALTLIFITLKLVGVIDWDWLWVMSPIWITGCIVLFLLIVFLVVYFRD